MKKSNLNEILINNSEFYNIEASYVGFLKKNNIKTISDLLDKNTEIIIEEKSYNDTRRKLRVLISLLRYKYFNEPLEIESLLDKKLDVFNSEKAFLKFIDGGGFSIYYFFGFNERISDDIFKSFRKYAIVNKPKAKLIDFFIWVIDSHKKDKTNKISKILVTYSNTLLEAYDKNKALGKDGLETLYLLKDEIISLYQKRDNLNQRIKNMEIRIEYLSGIINNGGKKNG